MIGGSDPWMDYGPESLPLVAESYFKILCRTRPASDKMHVQSARREILKRISRVAESVWLGTGCCDSAST
jgi:hypothetical protein